MLGAIGDATDDDARQPVFAFQPRDVVLGDGHLDDEAAGAVGDKFFPIGKARIGHGGFDDAEILRVFGIGGDDEAVVVMLDVILMTRRARRNDPRHGLGIVGVQDVKLARLVIMGVDQHEGARPRAAERQEEALVGLLINEFVGAQGRTDRVTPDGARTMVGIDADVVERAAVVGPSDVAARVGDFVIQVLSRRKIADADGVEFGSFVVGRIGNERMVGAMGGRAEVPIDFARGFGVAIEKDHFVPAATRTAA